MCEIISGHIISDKSHKDWGKVILKSGIHHELDREEIYKEYGKIKLTAWQTKKYASFSEGFEFTVSEGNIPEQKKELLKLLNDWAKKQDIKKIFLDKFLTVSENGKNILEGFTLDLENKCVALDKPNISFIAPEVKFFNWTAGYRSTQTAGDRSTQTAGDRSTQKAGSGSAQTAGYESTQTAGYGSTQTAGYRSTQTAGDRSTQTAGYGSTQIIYGDTSYIILSGKDVILRQIWWEDNQYHSAIVDHNELFKKYKAGDKLKIVKGKVVEVVR